MVEWASIACKRFTALSIHSVNCVCENYNLISQCIQLVFYNTQLRMTFKRLIQQFKYSKHPYLLFSSTNYYSICPHKSSLKRKSTKGGKSSPCWPVDITSSRSENVFIYGVVSISYTLTLLWQTEFLEISEYCRL